MNSKECLVLQNYETKDTVVFMHAFNDDEDEIYTYANNVVMLSLNYDTYHDMIDYYISVLHYDSIMSIQKA
nr:MAG TPA: hypothetical protein [Caudoviricetes sp.]